MSSVKRSKSINNEKSDKKAPKKRKHVTISYEEPNNWCEVLSNIREMRDEMRAAVDTMGAEHCYDHNNSDEKQKRFQILISLMLSSQTRDQTTFNAMIKLREIGLNIQNIIDMKIDELANVIKPVSFFNMKAKNMKKTAEILRSDYEDDIPNSVQSLMTLPGVGQKMAHLAMKIGWNETTGIAVDTHVHRVCNRLEWVETNKPEQTRTQLESWLPKQYWFDINSLLVGFGQTICLPRNPKCNQCLNKNICPFAKSIQI